MKRVRSGDGQAQRLERGVYRNDAAFPGLVVYSVINSHGDQIAAFEVASEAAGVHTVRWLFVWLDEVDPARPPLSVVRGSETPSQPASAPQGARNRLGLVK